MSAYMLHSCTSVILLYGSFAGDLFQIRSTEHTYLCQECSSLMNAVPGHRDLIALMDIKYPGCQLLNKYSSITPSKIIEKGDRSI